MIGAVQLRGARALREIDRRQLAVLSGFSAQTNQRMETSKGIIRRNVDSLTRLIAALKEAGIEFIAPGAISDAGGRGVRLTAAAKGKRTVQTVSDAQAA